MILTESTLRLLKVLHVLGAILFLGNVIVTGVWSAILFRHRGTVDFRIAARAIVLTDWVFTLGGAVLLVTAGVTLAIGRGLPMWETRWIRDAVIGLAIATAVWLIVLVPAQRRMLSLEPGSEVEVRPVYRRWTIAGWLAVLPLLWALWAMVFKPV